MFKKWSSCTVFRPSFRKNVVSSGWVHRKNHKPFFKYTSNFFPTQFHIISCWVVMHRECFENIMISDILTAYELQLFSTSLTKLIKNSISKRCWISGLISRSMRPSKLDRFPANYSYINEPRAKFLRWVFSKSSQFNKKIIWKGSFGMRNINLHLYAKSINVKNQKSSTIRVRKTVRKRLKTD